MKTSLKPSYHLKHYCNSGGTYFIKFKQFYTKCSMFWRNVHLWQQTSLSHHQKLIWWHVTLWGIYIQIWHLCNPTWVWVYTIFWNWKWPCHIFCCHKMKKQSGRRNIFSLNRSKNIGVSKIFLWKKQLLLSSLWWSSSNRKNSNNFLI
jgi:hypothetical protein